jgi:hypothetical protein
MAIKAGSFFGNVKGGFKLGKSKPKLQARFIRKKVNTNKNVKFAKKFFKKSGRVQRRWVRRKANLLKRKSAEKALEGGRAVLEGAKKSMTAKGGGFNPMRFVMMIFAGWLINQLPKLIAGIKKFIEWAKPAFEMLGKWVKGIIEFFKWIGGGVAKLWNAITGSSDSMEAEKKALKGKTDELEGTFKKQKEGFKDLEKKAKKEEGGIKKDLDDVDKEVKDEVQGDVEGKKTSTSSEGKTVASTTGSGKADPLVKTKSTPKTKLASRPQRIGTGKPVTVEIKGETVILQPGTVEYNNFFAPGGTKDKIIHTRGKVKDVNLVKTKSGPKIVTVDMPMPKNTPTQQNTTQTPINKGSSDGVNSTKEIALHGIDR